MAKHIQHIVASYDIHDPKRLANVAKIMKNFGQRVLKSVFECNLTSDGFEHMRQTVEDAIDHMEDSVRYYFICDKCLKNVEVSGLGVVFKEDESFIIT